MVLLTDELLDYLGNKFEEISQDPDMMMFTFGDYVTQWLGQAELELLRIRGVDIFA